MVMSILYWKAVYKSFAGVPHVIYFLDWYETVLFVLFLNIKFTAEFYFVKLDDQNIPHLKPSDNGMKPNISLCVHIM